MRFFLIVLLAIFFSNATSATEAFPLLNNVFVSGDCKNTNLGSTFYSFKNKEGKVVYYEIWLEKQNGKDVYAPYKRTLDSSSVSNNSLKITYTLNNGKRVEEVYQVSPSLDSFQLIERTGETENHQTVKNGAFSKTGDKTFVRKKCEIDSPLAIEMLTALKPEIDQDNETQWSSIKSERDELLKSRKIKLAEKLQKPSLPLKLLFTCRSELPGRASENVRAILDDQYKGNDESALMRRESYRCVRDNDETMINNQNLLPLTKLIGIRDVSFSPFFRAYYIIDVNPYMSVGAITP